MKKKLNFGAGTEIKKGWDNADIQPESPMSFDFDKFPYPINDNTYDYVLIKSVFEYLEEPRKVLDELWRICKPNAVIEIQTPHYNNTGAYNDMDYKHYFCEKTFITLVNEPYTLVKKGRFEIQSIVLQPTRIGRMIPKRIRNNMCLMIGGIISNMIIKLEVIKDEK